MSKLVATNYVEWNDGGSTHIGKVQQILGNRAMVIESDNYKTQYCLEIKKLNKIPKPISIKSDSLK